jgi:hypothetical protein
MQAEVPDGDFTFVPAGKRFLRGIGSVSTYEVKDIE